MVYPVMLDAVAELESRNIAVTAGFRNTKQLLAGMLNLSPTEAGSRVAHAGQLAPRRALTHPGVPGDAQNRRGLDHHPATQDHRSPYLEVLAGLVGPGARARWNRLAAQGEWRRLSAVLRFLFAVAVQFAS